MDLPLPEALAELCAVEGCDRPRHARGLCRTHLRRVETGGSPRSGVPIATSGHDGWITHGYRGVVVPVELRHLTEGRAHALEHRLAMAVILGRALRRDEVVHHRNGDRLDNRPSNLELWSTAQPKGQRVVDKLEFARWLLALYDGQDVERATEGEGNAETAPNGLLDV